MKNRDNRRKRKNKKKRERKNWKIREKRKIGDFFWMGKGNM